MPSKREVNFFAQFLQFWMERDSPRLIEQEVISNSSQAQHPESLSMVEVKSQGRDEYSWSLCCQFL